MADNDPGDEQESPWRSTWLRDEPLQRELAAAARRELDFRNEVHGRWLDPDPLAADLQIALGPDLPVRVTHADGRLNIDLTSPMSRSDFDRARAAVYSAGEPFIGRPITPYLTSLMAGAISRNLRPLLDEIEERQRLQWRDRANRDLYGDDMVDSMALAMRATGMDVARGRELDVMAGLSGIYRTGSEDDRTLRARMRGFVGHGLSRVGIRSLIQAAWRQANTIFVDGRHVVASDVEPAVAVADGPGDGLLIAYGSDDKIATDGIARAFAWDLEDRRPVGIDAWIMHGAQVVPSKRSFVPVDDYDEGWRAWNNVRDGFR